MHEAGSGKLARLLPTLLANQAKPGAQFVKSTSVYLRFPSVWGLISIILSYRPGPHLLSLLLPLSFTQKSSRNTHIKKHGVGALERLTAEETASRPGHHTQSSDGASDSDPSSDAESETAVGTSRDSVASPLLPSHTHSRTIAVEPRAVIVPAATAQ